MSQVRSKRWMRPPEIDAPVIDALESAVAASARQKGRAGMPRLICRLLAQRGIGTVHEAERFMKPDMSHLHDPMLMKGVPELVDRLVAVRERGETIGIHGDYDVDGLTSTTLYTRALRDLGFTIEPFVPHRMIDGYGVSVRALKDFHARGIRTLLTCDVGFSAVDEVRSAVDDMGMEVLITDHHLPSHALPKAHVLVNPHQAGDAYPFKDLCGVGVAYKVLQALVRRLGVPESTIERYLDLVALGTICDIVPLVDENRVFAKEGVKKLKETENLGLRMLLAVAEVRPETVTEQTCGWVLGPRLNAVGRINDAGKGLDLLLSDDKARAGQLAREIDALNTERKAMSKAIEASAFEIYDSRDLEDVYGLAIFGGSEARAQGAEVGVSLTTLDTVSGAEGGDPWHHGVIGIVASKVVERYGRPTIIFARDHATGKWKGSGRAPNIHGIHLKDALSMCAAHLEKYGGHEFAAGATLKGTTPEELEAFATAFDAAIRTQMRPEDRTPLLKADLHVTLDDLNENLHRILGFFAPFGHSNEGIKMMSEDVEILSVKVIGSDRTHYKFRVRQGATEFDALAWGFAMRYPEAMDLPTPFRADLFFKLDENEFRGQKSLQLVIDDMRLPRIQALGGPATAGLLKVATPALPAAQRAQKPLPAPTPEPEAERVERQAVEVAGERAEAGDGAEKPRRRKDAKAVAPKALFSKKKTQ